MMERIKGRRPSAAMIVAGAALVIALAGTAVAGPIAIKSVLNKPEKKQVKKIATNKVNELAGGLSVARATTATNAENADRLDQLDSRQISPSAGINDPDDVTLTATFQTVTSVTITVAASSRLNATAAVHLDGDGPAVNDRGDCQFTFDGVAVTGFSSDVPINDETMPVVATQTVGAGAHTVALQCLDNEASGGNVILRNANMHVTAHLEG